MAAPRIAHNNLAGQPGLLVRLAISAFNCDRVKRIKDLE